MSVIRKNWLKRLPIILMVMLLALAIAPAIVSAQDAPVEDPGDVVDDGDVSEDDAIENEASAFQNPSQAQKAENVANAAALDSDDAELADRVDALEAAEKELADAKEELSNLPDDVTPEEKAAAEQDVADAKENVDVAEQDVADRLSDISGEVEADITQMRKDGYGWGQICHELGVHPSVLGNKYGHMNTHQNKHEFNKKGALSAATERNVKTGWTEGLGKSASGKNKGRADSFGTDNNGKAKGKSNGKGVGNGKGNGKGNGNGKGKK